MNQQDVTGNRTNLLRSSGERQVSPDRDPAESWDSATFPDRLREQLTRQVKLELQNQDLNEIRMELEATAQDLAELYDSAPVGCFSLSKKGIVRQLNRTAATMLGSEREHVIGRNFDEFISPENRTFFRRFLVRVFTGGQPGGCEVTFIRQDLPAMCAVLTGALSAKGMVCHMAALDFSTQHRMEAAAREKKEDLELIFNRSHDLLCIANTDGRFHRVNPAFSRVLGYKKDVITRMGFLNLVHPEDVDSTKAAMERLDSGDEVLDFVNRYRCADGSYRFLEWRAIPYGQGMVCALARDITERKHAEEALRESEGRLSLFIRHAPAAIAMFDRKMRYVTVSDRWMKDYGLSGSLVGRSHYEVFPEIPEAWKEVHRRGLAGETLSSEGDKFQRSNGTIQWLKWDVRPWFLSTGEVGGILIGTEDITERHRVLDALEQEVQRRTSQLQARSLQLRALADELTHAEERERSRIAGLIHEDLQQMLVAALWNIGLLKSKHTHPADTADFSRIEGILQDSIKTARSLSSELSPAVLQQCGLASALKWLGQLSHEKYGLSVSVDADEGVEASPETGTVLYRSVSELLLNISKHAGVKSAKLHLWREDDTYLKILVADEGAGFDTVEVRAREGSVGGFGLFSIRERLEWLGGGLEIESAPGCGSRLTMWVPLKAKKSRSDRASNRSRGGNPPLPTLAK